MSGYEWKVLNAQRRAKGCRLTRKARPITKVPILSLSARLDLSREPVATGGAWAALDVVSKASALLLSEAKSVDCKP